MTNADPLTDPLDEEVQSDEDSVADENAVRRELNRVRKFVGDLSMDDLKSGDWFAKLLGFSLDRYVREVNADYFSKKYPHLPADAVVDARIKLATRYAGIEGGLSAGAYTGAVAATIGSAGGASPLTLPAAGATFTVDLIYTSQLQLRLAYDISVLYGVALNLADPEDLWKLIRVAFVIKSGEAAQGVVLKGVPAVVRPLVKKVFSGSTLAAAKSLPVIGKYLLQRNIIKFAIPAVGVPLSIAINFWTTKVAGGHARTCFREEARVLESARRMTEATDRHEELLWVLWMVIAANRTTHDSEKLLLHHVTTLVSEQNSELPALRDLKATIDVDRAMVWSKLASRSDDLEVLFNAGVTAAVIDGKIDAQELHLLESLAEHCAVTFDEDAIRKAAQSTK